MRPLRSALALLGLAACSPGVDAEPAAFSAYEVLQVQTDAEPEHCGIDPGESDAADASVEPPRAAPAGDEEYGHGPPPLSLGASR